MSNMAEHRGFFLRGTPVFNAAQPVIVGWAKMEEKILFENHFVKEMIILIKTYLITVINGMMLFCDCSYDVIQNIFNITTLISMLAN